MYELTSGAPPARLPEESASNDIVGLLRTLVRRRTIFAAIFVGFLALVMIITGLTPRSYTTHAKLIAGNPGGGASGANGSNTNLPVLNALLSGSGVQSAETYAELFQETPVAQQVIHDLALPISPSQLLDHITIKPITNTSILDLGVTWSDREMAAKITNQFATDFVARERDLVSSQATSALGFLSQQLPIAQQKMRAAAQDLSAYEATHNIADITSQTQSVLGAVSTTDSKIGQAQLDRQQAQAQLGSATAQMAGMKPSTIGGTSVAPNPVLAQLQQQEAQLNVQLQTAQQQYTEAHPTVVAFKQQLEHVRRSIAAQPQTIVSGTNTVPNPVYQQLSQQAAQYRAQIASDDAQLSELRNQRAALSPRIRALPQETAQLGELQRHAKLTEDVYTALSQKFNDATVLKTTALSDVTITQPATPQSASAKPNLRLNLLVGTVIAVLLGLVGALVADFLDNSLKDERDVERELALPVLASIPSLAAGGKEALPWVRSLTIESFLQLVTSLRYSSDQRLRTIAVTSPLQGDGKSTIALNTAIAMAELEGRVLLVDADLRRPSLHKKFKQFTSKAGLSDLLVGNAELESVVRHTSYEGLDVMMSGTPTPNPVKLLQSARFDQVIERALQKYRMVILDAPALNPVIDAAILAAKAEGTVIVISAGLTDTRSTKKALQKLEALGVRNILGAVINRVDVRRSDFSQYYLPPEQGALPQEAAAEIA